MSTSDRITIFSDSMTGQTLENLTADLDDAGARLFLQDVWARL
jgi:hypothetical protein